ncbi:hypothetical protein BDV93DRAFT_565624 [Ceratobasidium sp. AG-I]|nr:hypothetical protein BDV93DRAFT_565624 [Ceratobasidium sp. AG-I]
MVIMEVLRQTGLDSGDKLVRLALERIIPWIGDELTAARCQGLKLQRQEEGNTYDRLDPFIFIFGWFHTLMCLASSTFENHRGSAAGLGFSHSVLVLSRCGFSENMRSTRPDYHTVKELLQHEFEARVQGLWLWATDTTSLEELREWLECPDRTPDDIYHAGERIQRERVSKSAVSLYRCEMEDSLVDATDPVLFNTLIQNRDLLVFWDLVHDVKHGHVGHMEDLLPDLLVYFAGGKHAHYAKQMYELLQLLNHECTPAIRYAILENCFLVNTAGRPNSFYPIDKRQELNNAGIRAYAPPPQGGSTWEQYEQMSVLVPTYAEIVKHVETSITRGRRSKIHKDPPWERDVMVLLNDQAKTNLHNSVPSRALAKSSDKGKDFIQLGTIKLQDGKSLAAYAEQRELYFKSRVTTNDLSCYIQT